jgi:hypothetical protein
VYSIKDVDNILEYITARIIMALNIVAPEREIRVKKGPNLYLRQETLQAMKKRDSATGKRYRNLRKEVSRLVKRDKQDSNLLSLKKASNDPKVLWQLADQALGKDRPSLPASITRANGPTTTPMEAADEALGVDKITTSVLKKGVEILAGPISHLVNRSLAEGKVPAQFKIGRVHPIYKGKGKPREDPGPTGPSRSCRR